MQSSAELCGSNHITQEHRPHLPKITVGPHQVPVIFLHFGEEFFFPLPQTQCLDSDSRITRATPFFLWTIILTLHCFSCFYIPRVLVSLVALLLPSQWHHQAHKELCGLVKRLLLCFLLCKQDCKWKGLTLQV